MKDLVSNRKARHDYEIIDSYEAGLILKGTEIKSLRSGGGNLQEAYVKIFHGEIWLIGAYIAPYSHGNVHNHDERRDRKLLLHSYEIEKLHGGIQLKGMTLVPLAMYFKNGRVKVKIGVAKGKKKADKRSVLKERQQLRDIDRAIGIADRMETGTVQINGPPARGPDHFPFQGVKDSGIGSQGIVNSIEMMTKVKTTVINLAKPSYATA